RLRARASRSSRLRHQRRDLQRHLPGLTLQHWATGRAAMDLRVSMSSTMVMHFPLTRHLAPAERLITFGLLRPATAARCRKPPARAVALLPAGTRERASIST